MTNKPRLIWVLPSLETGGTERQAAFVLPHLARSFNPVVVTLYREGPLVETLRGAGIEIRCLNGRSLYDRQIGSQLRGVIEELQPALVHSFLWDANVWAALAMRKNQSVPLFTSRREIGLWRKRRHLLAEKWTNRIARRIVVNSEAARRYTIETEQVQAEKLIVIPNAVDLSLFEKLDRVAMRRQLNLPSETFTLAVVASLAEKKGHWDLLQALARISNEIEPFQLLIVGAGNEEQALENLVAKLGLSENVQFLGLREDVPEILGACDLLVHPSYTESLPNAVLEAMAAGIPVVATDAGGTSEIIQNSEMGLLVPIGSPELLAEAIQSLASDPARCKNLAEKGHQSVRQRFGIEVTCRAYEKVYLDEV